MPGIGPRAGRAGAAGRRLAGVGERPRPRRPCRCRGIGWSGAGFGLADVEQAVAVRPESVFRLASISKPITAVAVMQLVERGLVSLEDPIQKLTCRDFARPAGRGAVAYLLTHTSGIRHLPGNEFASRAVVLLVRSRA
ncbi:MAG: serine hydrolase domain-containing protein [Vicinamibacterales bacterium]